MTDTKKRDGLDSLDSLVRPTILLDIQMYVECPHCGEEHDLARSEFNAEGEHLSALFTGDSYDWRKNLDGSEFECPECNKTFELGEIEW